MCGLWGTRWRGWWLYRRGFMFFVWWCWSSLRWLIGRRDALSLWLFSIVFDWCCNLSWAGICGSGWGSFIGNTEHVPSQRLNFRRIYCGWGLKNIPGFLSLDRLWGIVWCLWVRSKLELNFHSSLDHYTRFKSHQSSYLDKRQVGFLILRWQGCSLISLFDIWQDRVPHPGYLLKHQENRNQKL